MPFLSLIAYKYKDIINLRNIKVWLLLCQLLWGDRSLPTHEKHTRQMNFLPNFGSDRQ